MTLKKNSKLKNVKDIYGTLHKNVVVLNIYKNTVAAKDTETKKGLEEYANYA